MGLDLRRGGTHQGISDLVGNVWEWNDGLKIVDGRLYFPADNNFNGEESGWTASGVYFDASAGPGNRDGYAATGVPILSTSVTKYSEIPTPAGGGDVGNFDAANRGGESGWRLMGLSTAYDGLPPETRQKLAQLLIAPKLASSDDPLFPVKGGLWVRNYGTRVPLRGGNWGAGSAAGLGALTLYSVRATSNLNIGLRAALPLSQKPVLHGEPVSAEGKRSRAPSPHSCGENIYRRGRLVRKCRPLSAPLFPPESL